MKTEGEQLTQEATFPLLVIRLLRIKKKNVENKLAVLKCSRDMLQEKKCISRGTEAAEFKLEGEYTLGVFQEPN